MASWSPTGCVDPCCVVLWIVEASPVQRCAAERRLGSRSGSEVLYVNDSKSAQRKRVGGPSLLQFAVPSSTAQPSRANRPIVGAYERSDGRRVPRKPNPEGHVCLRALLLRSLGWCPRPDRMWHSEEIVYPYQRIYHQNLLYRARAALTGKSSAPHRTAGHQHVKNLIHSV